MLDVKFEYNRNKAREAIADHENVNITVTRETLDTQPERNLMKENLST